MSSLSTKVISAINLNKQSKFIDDNNSNSTNNNNIPTETTLNDTAPQTYQTLYIYPTLVVFPLLLVLISTLIGNYSILTKILFSLLIVLSLSIYMCQLKQIDIITTCKRLLFGFN